MANEEPRGRAHITLGSLLAALTCVILWGPPLLAASSDVGSPVIEVWKSATCQCCGNWVMHLEANGFTVKVNAASPSMLDQLKKEAGIGEKLTSCHTAKIDGYVIEGHVPAADIKRLVVEKPNAIGLTVPGMVAGSPGMEQGGKSDPYKVLLVKKDGTTEVFSNH